MGIEGQRIEEMSRTPRECGSVQCGCTLNTVVNMEDPWNGGPIDKEKRHLSLRAGNGRASGETGRAFQTLTRTEVTARWCRTPNATSKIFFYT
jgi:hypothetical protein